MMMMIAEMHNAKGIFLNTVGIACFAGIGVGRLRLYYQLDSSACVRPTVDGSLFEPNFCR